jgi:hypothetical protein
VGRRLDDFVLDPLIIERLLDLPAGVDVVVDEGEEAAVKPNAWHPGSLFAT